MYKEIKVKKIFVYLVIVTFAFATLGVQNVKFAKAATLTKQWSYTDSQSGLNYYCYEYNDGSFKVVENDHGAIRTITGRAYLDNGYPKAAVDQTTSSFWDSVTAAANKRAKIEAALALANVFLSPYIVSGDYVIYKSLLWAFINDIIASNVDRTAYDVVKVAFEASCANQCAIDLAHTPGIILPSFIRENT